MSKAIPSLNRVVIKVVIVADIALDDELNDESVEILKFYTCNIYGRKATSNASLNQHREKGYGPNASAKNSLEKLKGINANTNLHANQNLSIIFAVPRLLQGCGQMPTRQ